MRSGINCKRSLIALLSLLLAFEAFAPQVMFPHRRAAFKRPAAGGGSSCSDATFNPDTDTDVGDWLRDSGSAAYYTYVDDGRGVAGSDFIYKFEDGTSAKDTLRYSLSGGCNVTKITVYQYGESNSGTPTITVEVSPDNSNWTSVQNIVLSTTQQERSATFTSLSWSSPSFCYVRFGTSGPGNFETCRIWSMAVRVNEP